MSFAFCCNRKNLLCFSKCPPTCLYTSYVVSSRCSRSGSHSASASALVQERATPPPSCPGCSTKDLRCCTCCIFSTRVTVTDTPFLEFFLSFCFFVCSFVCSFFFFFSSTRAGWGVGALPQEPKQSAHTTHTRAEGKTRKNQMFHSNVSPTTNISQFRKEERTEQQHRQCSASACRPCSPSRTLHSSSNYPSRVAFRRLTCKTTLAFHDNQQQRVTTPLRLSLSPSPSASVPVLCSPVLNREVRE